jgi:flagellar hook-length control protein FliK
MNGVAVPDLGRALAGAPAQAVAGASSAVSAEQPAAALPVPSVQAWLTQWAQQSTVPQEAAVSVQPDALDTEPALPEMPDASGAGVWLQPLPAMQVWGAFAQNVPLATQGTSGLVALRQSPAAAAQRLDMLSAPMAAERLLRSETTGLPVAHTSSSEAVAPLAAVLAQAATSASNAVVAARSMGDGASASIPNHTISQAVSVQQGPQALVQALAQRLQVQQLQGTQVAVVRLDPPQMGTIEVRISHDASGVHVQMQASHSEVGRQLAAVVDPLRQELLARTGDAHISVASSRSTSTGGQQDAQRQAAAWDEEPEIGQALQGEQRASHA